MRVHRCSNAFGAQMAAGPRERRCGPEPRSSISCVPSRSPSLRETAARCPARAGLRRRPAPSDPQRLRWPGALRAPCAAAFVGGPASLMEGVRRATCLPPFVLRAIGLLSLRRPAPRRGPDQLSGCPDRMRGDWRHVGPKTTGPRRQSERSGRRIGPVTGWRRTRTGARTGRTRAAATTRSAKAIMARQRAGGRIDPPAPDGNAKVALTLRRHGIHVTPQDRDGAREARP